MTETAFSFHTSRSQSIRMRNRPLTAMSIFQNIDHIVNRRAKNSSHLSKRKTIHYLKTEESEEQQNNNTFLKLFDAKCLDSKIPYSTEKALMFLNRFNKCNKRKLQLNAMDLGYNTMLILCQMLRSREYYYVDLQKNKLGDASMVPLAQLLSTSNNIVYLNIGSNGIKEVGSENLFQSLKVNCSVTHLELGSRNGYNRNSIKMGTNPLCEALRTNNTLIYLGLSHTHLGEVALNNLFEGLRYNKSIMDLNLSNNDLGPDLMEIVVKILRNHDLVNLNLSNNQFGNDATKQLFQFFNAYNRNLKLKQLYYNNNGMNHKTAYYVFETLRSNISFQKLSFNQNSFSQEVSSLQYFLDENNTIEELYFQNCGCNKSFMKSLCLGVAKSKSLKILSLSFNKLGNEGGITFFKCLDQNKSLVRLQLNKCQLGDDAIDHFAQGFKNNRSMVYINLSDNYINDQGGKKIRQAISLNNMIREIQLQSNLMGFRTLGIINDKLKLNRQKYINNKFPMKRDHLRVLQNQIKEQESGILKGRQQIIDKSNVIRQQIQVLEEKQKQISKRLKTFLKIQQRQYQSLDHELKALQKISFSNNEIQDLKDQIELIRQQIIIQKEAIVQLQRQTLGLLKKPCTPKNKVRRVTRTREVQF